jgi:uncharacterized membrane protein YpjA
MLRTLQNVLHRVLHTPLLFWPVVVANGLGAVLGGLYWYGPMLWQSPLWALPFVPDCPLAALLWMIAAFGVRAGRRWRFFNALTTFASIKYGIWTIAFWLYVWSNAGFAADPAFLAISVLLFVAHIGLLLQGLLLIPESLPLSLPKRVAVCGWFILSIYVDYVLNYHPPLGLDMPEQVAFWVAALSTALLTTALIAFAPLLGVPEHHPAAEGHAHPSLTGR